MATIRAGHTRFAIVAKATGKVVKIKNMRTGSRPMLDPEKYEAMEVAGDPRRLAPTDVQPGMVRVGDGFAWPAA